MLPAAVGQHEVIEPVRERLAGDGDTELAGVGEVRQRHAPRLGPLAEDHVAGRAVQRTRLDPSQWKSARTTNAIERLNEEFRRRIKTQTVLPCTETVPMLLWALMASGQIQMRKVDGWEALSQPIDPIALDLAA